MGAELVVIAIPLANGLEIGYGYRVYASGPYPGFLAPAFVELCSW